jgi:hypothetical protein
MAFACTGLAIQHAANGVRDFESSFAVAFIPKSERRMQEFNAWLDRGKSLQ